MKKISILLLLLVFIPFLPADTLDVEAVEIDLDVKTAVNLALANNLDLEREKIKFEGKKWAAATSWNVVLPAISVKSTLSRTNLDEYYRTTTELDSDNTLKDTVGPLWSLSTNFDISLQLHANIVFAIYQAAIDYKGGKISLETIEKKIARDVKKCYYNLVLIQENLSISNINEAAAKKRYERALALYQNGQKDRLYMLDARIKYENLLPAKQEMENSYKIALLSFKHLLGLKDSVDLRLTDTISIDRIIEFDEQVLIEAFLDKKLEVQAWENNLKTLRNSRNLAITALTPFCAISYSMDPRFQGDPENEKWFRYAEEWRQSEGGLSFVLEIPIGAYAPFSREQMAIVQANFAIKEHLVKKEQLNQKSVLEIKKIVLEINRIIGQLQILETNLELARETLSLTEQKYNLGTKELGDIEDAMKQLNIAENNLLKARYNYVAGLLDLEYSLNVSIDTVLEVLPVNSEK